MSVKIVPNKTTGALATAFKSNPEFGFIHIHSNDIVPAAGGWFRESNRDAIIKGKMTVLNAVVAGTPTLELPGRIMKAEFKESEIPAYYESFLDQSKPREEALLPNVKRAGKDGINLTIEGQRIISFCEYDGTGEMLDMTLKHDNIEAVRLAKVASKNEAASL